MSRVSPLALTLLLLLAPAARAQGAAPLVKYGKWVLAAGAVGMNLLAASAHDDAEAAFDQIEEACFADRIRCIVNVEGRYADAQIEALYQTSLHEDRVARRWLILGETALVGAAAMFVWELTRKSHEPENIPFEPEVRSLRNATGVGVRIAW
jgi:hypothetical protein